MGCFVAFAAAAAIATSSFAEGPLVEQGKLDLDAPVRR